MADMPSHKLLFPLQPSEQAALVAEIWQSWGERRAADLCSASSCRTWWMRCWGVWSGAWPEPHKEYDGNDEADDWHWRAHMPNHCQTSHFCFTEVFLHTNTSLKTLSNLQSLTKTFRWSSSTAKLVRWFVEQSTPVESFEVSTPLEDHPPTLLKEQHYQCNTGTNTYPLSRLKSQNLQDQFSLASYIEHHDDHTHLSITLHTSGKLKFISAKSASTTYCSERRTICVDMMRLTTLVFPPDISFLCVRNMSSVFMRTATQAVKTDQYSSSGTPRLSMSIVTTTDWQAVVRRDTCVNTVKSM